MKHRSSCLSLNRKILYSDGVEPCNVLHSDVESLSVHVPAEESSRAPDHSCPEQSSTGRWQGARRCWRHLSHSRSWRRCQPRTGRLGGGRTLYYKGWLVEVMSYYNNDLVCSTSQIHAQDFFLHREFKDYCPKMLGHLYQNLTNNKTFQSLFCCETSIYWLPLLPPTVTALCSQQISLLCHRHACVCMWFMLLEHKNMRQFFVPAVLQLQQSWEDRRSGYKRDS